MNKQQEVRIYNVLKEMRARYDEMSEAEQKRFRTCLKYWKNRHHDDGALGRIEELLSLKESSQRFIVNMRITDGWIMVDGKRYGYERKTNGGRIEALRRSECQFVVYSLDFTQKHKATKKHEAYEEYRHIEPVLIPKDIFLNTLDRLGATKCTNGVRPEEAIQVSSKAWYEWLKDWVIPFDKYCKSYSWSDFEGLE